MILRTPDRHGLPRKPERLANPGQWLEESFPWRWWITHTFKCRLSESDALQVLRGWLGSLAKQSGMHIHAAYGLELQQRGAPHFHVLLFSENPGHRLQEEELDRTWREEDRRSGSSVIKPYCGGLGWGEYLCKEGNWDLRIGCHRPPRCRKHHRGCAKEFG